MIHEITKFYDEERGMEYEYRPIEETLTVKETGDGWVAKYLAQDPIPDPPNNSDDECFLAHYHRDFTVDPDQISVEDVKAWYRGEEALENYWVFPVKSLIHGIVHLDIGTDGFAEDPGGWDTSHVGVVCVAKKGKKKEEAEREARLLISDWNTYLRGDVYLLVVEKYDREKKPIETDITATIYGYENALQEIEDGGSEV